MIEFKISNSLKEEINGTHKYQFNSISLGKALSNHLVVFDPSIELRETNLFTKGQSLFIRNYDQQRKVIVNEKNFMGTKKIKVGDKIRIGKMVLEIISFKHLEQQREDISSLISKKLKSHPKLASIFKGIENELLKIERLEYEMNHSTEKQDV